MSRKKALESLICFDRPLDLIMNELRKYPWESSVSYHVLKRNDIVSILSRFIRSELNAMDVCEWAEEMEGRIASDLERELGYSHRIRETLNFLSTDQRVGRILTVEDAKREIIRLNNAAVDPTDEYIRPIIATE